ncbi:MAG: hypothetical protein GF311_24605 [Candidatus Lokiarchaeota archaeon]|nr:hypothetical protein [Candidatus Lokiarchaeota archaeon]
MHIDEKKIYFVLSPHINYYHSYRGDSRGPTGFGKDMKLMRAILDKLDEIEDKGLCNGKMRMTWDYADTFWSIQLQQEYQQDVLERVIERCKAGKDEVLIGSWGNVAQPVLDTEQFEIQHQWFLENSMGIGVKQLFGNRIAPYARTQETMFTQGMIEQYNKLGVEGIGIYYSVYPFDVSRPFLNPRLDLNQRYGLVEFQSAVSNTSMLMIPMYAFGDILDYYSIKKWFERIRKYQEKDLIEGHALLFLNFDMDYDNWIGVSLPKFLNWMPNTRGLDEFAEIVDGYEHVEFANLLDVIPKMKVYGKTILKQDVADGNWNGFYNWAQKYNNTRFWTVGQRARWFKCISDTLCSTGLTQKKNEIAQYIRNEDAAADTYIKNQILFASTTNFGMSMPFQHPHRRKTAMNYAIRSHHAADKALSLAMEDSFSKIYKNIGNEEIILTTIPIVNRGISERERVNIISPLLIKTELSNQIIQKLDIRPPQLLIKNDIDYYVYHQGDNSGHTIEAIIDPARFSDNRFFQAKLEIQEEKTEPSNNELRATKYEISNEFITIKLDQHGKIHSLRYKDEEFGCDNFLDSAVVFGDPKKEKRYSASIDDIIVMRDGSDGFSAKIKLISQFKIIQDASVVAEKTITLYAGLKHIFVEVKMKLCDIKGEKCSEDGTSFVEDPWDERWREVMPCEIKPKIIGTEAPLRVWKRNFMGYVSYFDCDMKLVDPKNFDIGCMVANISDGWMALTNNKKGILVGFNALKAANFAFSPIKIKDKGFGDAQDTGQQIRINPFGTYYGEHFNYWTKGSGHAQEIIPQLFGTYHSTASTFSGKEVQFELILSPYIGNQPPKEIQNFADHFSLPPLILIGNKQNPRIYDNYSLYNTIAENLVKEFGIEELLDMSYLEWVRKVNENFDPEVDGKVKPKPLNLSLKLMIRLLIDGIRGR